MTFPLPTGLATVRLEPVDLIRRTDDSEEQGGVAAPGPSTA
ncbi:MAG: hypothetical protein R2729_23070 [Bryobacteraceae bacterium]